MFRSVYRSHAARYPWMLVPAYAAFRRHRRDSESDPQTPPGHHCSENRMHRGGSQFKSSHGAFGVRRPLRYLAHQLELDDPQTRKVAAVLNRLKTEQEQSVLDERRATAALADAFEGEEVGVAAISEAMTVRKAAAERLHAESEAAVKALFAALDADQRERLADLLRAGSFSL